MEIKNLDRIKDAMRDAIRQAMDDDGVWKAIDEEIQAFLDRERCCYLSFHPGPEALIGIGQGDAAIKLPVEISIEDYAEFDLSEPFRSRQLEDVKEQIAGIDGFIKRLESARADLINSLPPPPVTETQSKE